MGIFNLIVNAINKADRKKDAAFIEEFSPYGEIVKNPRTRFETDTLYIKKHGKIFRKLLIAKPVEYVHTKKEPDKLVYTSATVGGITTGGFHVQSGNTSYYTSNSGKFAVAYCPNNSVHGSPAIEIFLSEQIYNAAKKSGLSGLFENKYRSKDKRHRYGINTTRKSKEECDKLINWLAN